MGVLIAEMAPCYKEVAAVICLLGRFYREECPPRLDFRALNQLEWMFFPFLSFFSFRLRVPEGVLGSSGGGLSELNWNLYIVGGIK